MSSAQTLPPPIIAPSRIQNNSQLRRLRTPPSTMAGSQLQHSDTPTLALHDSSGPSSPGSLASSAVSEGCSLHTSTTSGPVELPLRASSMSPVGTALDATSAISENNTSSTVGPGGAAGSNRVEEPSKPSAAASSQPKKSATLEPPARPPMIRFHSSPSATLSPSRHHVRLQNSGPREIRQNLHASYKEDSSGRTINQYLIKESIGHGAYGEVFLSIDTKTGERVALKVYSKSRLRKMNRSKQRGGRPPRSSPEDRDNLSLITRELAIMKKLDHPNIVSLIEVLNEPQRDSLYMVLELVEQGTLSSRIGKLSEEQCRLYFRDMILGIEYLHSQGVMHRDIKADNLLISDDDVLKIGDFGVSEIFEHHDDGVMKTAGSPAYMPPELVVLLCGEYIMSSPIAALGARSGRSADIWSMGITLYHMLFRRLPFEADDLQTLYDLIITSEVEIPSSNPQLVSLLQQLLQKSPEKRITMAELRQHPWVTCNGEDELLSAEENTAADISPVTEEDLVSAIERIKPGMDSGKVAERLGRLHGWRATSRSRDPSQSPAVRPQQGDNDDVNILKLSYALNDMLAREGL